MSAREVNRLDKPHAETGGLPGALRAQPALYARCQAFLDQLWRQEALPHRLLHLCRLRIAAVHGCEQAVAFGDSRAEVGQPQTTALAAGDLAGFTEAEQAALRVAEQLPFDHHAISDRAFAEVKAAWGTEATVALLVALAFFDVICRWHGTLGQAE